MVTNPGPTATSCDYKFTFFPSLIQPFVIQGKPGRLQLFYKQEAERGHAWGKGGCGVKSVPGRPHRALLNYRRREREKYIIFLFDKLNSQEILTLLKE